MYNQRREDPNKVYINEEIRAHEVRVTGPEGENYGILSKRDAINKAKEANLDLIIVSAKAVPPVAKIMDYGKFTYEQKKKAKEVKAKSHVTETKNVQVKIGTGERDKELKANRIIEWLTEGHRVKVDLFLWGHYKYMDKEFLTERLQQFLKMVPVPYKIADPIKKSPKGFSCTIERDKSEPMPSKEEIEAAVEQMKLEKKNKKKAALEAADTESPTTE
jgi:translation initiation factor IF-3